MKARKINVAVLMGGRTAEHEISVASGQMVVKNLDLHKYNVKPITITREGAWVIPKGYLTDGCAVAKLLPKYVDEKSRGGDLEPVSTGKALSRTISEKVDVVFLAMHGPYGEDGTIQGLLEVLDLPYTGSDVESSAISMNKIRCKQIYRYHRIPTPRFVVVEEREWQTGKNSLVDRVEEKLGFPCVTKPPRLGSSVGMEIVSEKKALCPAVDLALRYGRSALIEEFISGKELTSPVLGNKPGEKPTALPLVEIAPRTSKFFDYKAKYTPGGSDEISPARLDVKVTRKAQRLGVKTHEALGCGGLSRTDMILSGESLYVLETNTIPGLTELSLFPKAARAMGMSFTELLSHLIEVAIETHRSKRICVDR